MGWIVKTEGDPLTVLSLPAAKRFLEVTTTDDDTLIQELIGPAVRKTQEACGQILPSTQFTLKLDKFPSGSIMLRNGPFISLDAIRYNDTDGNPQTMAVATEVYKRNIQDEFHFGCIEPVDENGWPDTDETPENIEIDWTAGYNTVPQTLLLDAKQNLSNSYEVNRGDIVPEGQSTRTMELIAGHIRSHA